MGNVLFIQAAADVICSQLGYEFGSVATSTCSSYGGSDLCGSPEAHVAMANLDCSGGELDIQECSYTEPNATCLDHMRDSIIFCSDGKDAGQFAEGTLRLLGVEGAPSISGAGRLEVFSAGKWAPVCRTGFSKGAATVACKGMGFAGANHSDDVDACRLFRSENYCGEIIPRLSEFTCVGDEGNLMDCPHAESDDVGPLQKCGEWRTVKRQLEHRRIKRANNAEISYPTRRACIVLSAHLASLYAPQHLLHAPASPPSSTPYLHAPSTARWAERE